MIALFFSVFRFPRHLRLGRSEKGGASAGDHRGGSRGLIIWRREEVHLVCFGFDRSTCWGIRTT